MNELLGSFFGTIAAWVMDKFLPKFLLHPAVKVLIVDDFGEPLDEVQNFFKEYHPAYKIIIASSIKSAKKQLENEQPNYAVIDLCLDQTSKNYEGIEVIKFIFDRELSIHPIILSGYKLEYVEEHLNKELANFPKKLEELKNNYVYKATRHPGGYIVELLEKLTQLEKEKQLNKK